MSVVILFSPLKTTALWPGSISRPIVEISHLGSRVTRLGEISPNGRQLAMGCFSKIIEVAKNVWPLCSPEKAMY
jgi:hypothetical protein